MILDKLVLKRGTSTKCNAYVGRKGEIVYDTSNELLRVYTKENNTTSKYIATFNDVPNFGSLSWKSEIASVPRITVTDDANGLDDDSKTTFGEQYKALVTNINSKFTTQNTTNKNTSDSITAITKDVTTVKSNVSNLSTSVEAIERNYANKNSSEETFAGKLKIKGTAQFESTAKFNNNITAAGSVTAGSFETDGNIVAEGDITAKTFTATSDIRRKENLKKCDDQDVIKSLANIDVYSYDLKNDSHPGQRYGVVAQQVQQLFPDLVKQDKDGYYGIDYAGLTALCLSAIKDLSSRLEKLEQQNK